MLLGELSAARQNSTAVYEYRRGESGVEWSPERLRRVWSALSIWTPGRRLSE
jgi:hypothetical protein